MRNPSLNETSRGPDNTYSGHRGSIRDWYSALYQPIRTKTSSVSGNTTVDMGKYHGWEHTPWGRHAAPAVIPIYQTTQTSHHQCGQRPRLHSVHHDHMDTLKCKMTRHVDCADTDSKPNLSHTHTMLQPHITNWQSRRRKHQSSMDLTDNTKIILTIYCYHCHHLRLLTCCDHWKIPQVNHTIEPNREEIIVDVKWRTPK